MIDKLRDSRLAALKRAGFDDPARALRKWQQGSISSEARSVHKVLIKERLL